MVQRLVQRRDPRFFNQVFEKPGNRDEKFMRSIIRHSIVPQCLKVNPGLRKVIKKKIIDDYSKKWENKN